MLSHVPELPDVELYRTSIERVFCGSSLRAVRIVSPFLLRTVDPPPSAASGSALIGTRRIGKRVVLVFEGDVRFVIHLMIAGRFRLGGPAAPMPAKIGLAAFDFDGASLLLTEAGSKRRASLHVVRGDDALAELDPGGIEPLEASLDDYAAVLRRENRTLKRALTDPSVFSGIGNAYSDEILHSARLSPAARTQRLDGAAVARLRDATRSTLRCWTRRLAEEFATRFPGPGDVTAFRPDFAVHGRYGHPCPSCGSPVQRIRYADSEANYCATCQADGRLLADRGRSRLLGADWPKTLEELEHRRAERAVASASASAKGGADPPRT